MSGATETGAVAGAVLGPLLLSLFPLAGIAIGAGGGALVGRLLDTGVDDAFVDDVKATLAPGASALFLVINGGEATAVVAALRPYQGTILQTTLPPDWRKRFATR